MFGFKKDKQKGPTPVELIDGAVARIETHGFSGCTYGGAAGYSGPACLIGSINLARGAKGSEGSNNSPSKCASLNVVLDALDEIATQHGYHSTLQLRPLERMAICKMPSEAIGYLMEARAKLATPTTIPADEREPAWA